MKKVQLLLVFTVLCLSSFAQTQASSAITEQEKVTVIVPKECKIGTEFEIKLIYNSTPSIQVTDSEAFLIVKKSSSKSMKNEITTHEDTYTIQAIKDGTHRIDEVLFEYIPENLTIDPIEFKVNY